MTSPLLSPLVQVSPLLHYATTFVASLSWCLSRYSMFLHNGPQSTHKLKCTLAWYMYVLQKDILHNKQSDWLFVVYRPSRWFFTHIKTSLLMLAVKGYKWTYARRSLTLALHTYCDTWNRTVKWRLRSVAATIRTSNLPLTRRMFQCSSKWAGTYFPVRFRHSGDVFFTLSFDPSCLPLWSGELFICLWGGSSYWNMFSASFACRKR